MSLDRLEALGHKVEPFITHTSIQSMEIAPDGSAFDSADPRPPDSAAVGAEEFR